MQTIKQVPEKYIDTTSNTCDETYYPLSKMENLEIIISVLGGQVILGLLVYIIAV